MEPVVERQSMEVAHVLYLDMVGYSRLSLDEQLRRVDHLRELVRGTPEFLRHEAGEDLVCSDTGDGMALVFFRDPQSPIRCACQIAAALGTPPRLPIRIGLHSGSVFRTQDINDRRKVTGPGVNVAQRVMDCGDAGHILLSRSYADLLRPLELWRPNLHDLGEVTVKHGVQLSLFSFHGADCGNPAPPRRPRLPPASVSPAPTNLPFWRTDQFVGRAPTLALVHGLLQAAAPVVLVGLSGLGKTQLALQYAHLHPQDYPGGVFWINAADSDHLKDGFVTLGRSFFDIPEDLSTESCVARLRARLHHLPQPTLFVFDNVTEETDLSLLPVSPQCRLLLTAQQKHLAPPGFELVELPKLDPDAALTLLGVTASPLGGEDLAAARQIADDVGRLPIALALIAQHRARLRRGFADYRRRFLDASSTDRPEEQKLLNVLERARAKFVTTTGHKGRIYETIQRSYLSLAPAARTILAAAACFAPASLERGLLWDVLGPEEGDESWEESLADLADALLISEEEAPAEPGASEAQSFAPRLRLHELVRLFARMQIAEDEYRAHVSRLSEVLTDRLQSANDKLDWRSIRPEMAHLIYTVSECRVLELPESLYPLLISQGQYLILHREFIRAEACLREALIVVENLYGKLHRSYAHLLSLLGEAEQMQGHERGALSNARSALWVAKRVLPPGDPELPVYYRTIGFVLKDQKKLNRARRFYQRMITLYTQTLGPNHPDVALGLNNLGLLLKEQGELGEAEMHLRRALAIEQAHASEGGATPGMAVYWNSLGRIVGQQERWADALECHQAALAIGQRIHGPNHPNVASYLYYSAVACQSMHQWQDAETYYQDALRLYQQLFGSDSLQCSVVREGLNAIKEERGALP